MPIVEPEVTLGPGGELPGLNSFPKVITSSCIPCMVGIHLIDYVLHSKACHDPVQTTALRRMRTGASASTAMCFGC